MNYYLFDPEDAISLSPFTLTNSVADLFFGCYTNKERWEKYLNNELKIISAEHLKPKYSYEKSANSIYINAKLIPSTEIVNYIKNLGSPAAVFSDSGALIFLSCKEELANQKSIYDKSSELESTVLDIPNHQYLNKNWEIFTHNDRMIRSDLEFKKTEGDFVELSDTNTIIGDEVYIEKGAKVEGAILNSKTGPIYISKDAEVMEGSMIRGPLFMDRKSVLKMGAKVYGATSLGPFCKVGGEVNNCIFMGYSNKGHDGFLGNSVIGHWCNLGADTNCSNLKNNYSNIKIYSYETSSYENSDLQFAGVFIGDHSKTSINCMINTGTVVGSFCNIYGPKFPDKFVPDFSWGNKNSWDTHNFEKAMNTARRVMSRRNIDLTDNDISVYKNVYNLTRKQPA